MGVKIFHATLLTQTRQYFFIFVTVDGGMVHRLCTATISTLMIQLTRKPQVCLNKVLCMSVVKMLAAEGIKQLYITSCYQSSKIKIKCSDQISNS